MKKILFIIHLSIFIPFTLTGCASFEDQYKPIYQTKPDTKTIKKN